MFAEEIRRAIPAMPRVRLAELAAAVWKGFACGAIGEQDAQQLADQIHARKAIPPTPVAPRKPVGSRPRSPTHMERRRRWTGSGWLPPQIACRFTMAETAVLSTIAAEVARRGLCRLTIGHIAVMAGVSRTTVQTAIHPAARPDIYEERLDSSRLDASVFGPSLIAYLRVKYAGLTFDTVIAESTAATHLLLSNPDLFASAHRYAIDPGVTVPSPASGIEVIQSQGNWAMGSFQTLASVMPDVKRVVVVTDSSLVGQANKRKLLAAAAPALPPGVALETWDDFTFAELADRSTRLPQGSVLFYTPVFRDRMGERDTPISVLRSLAKSASVPIFAYHDLYLGQGVVGGRLLSAQRFGTMMADLALGPAYAERWIHDEASLTPIMFDDAQLRRWGIPDRRLPPGSIIVGREIPDWRRYSFGIGLAVAALVAEAGLILWLMRALRQRNVAVRDVMRERDGLELRVAERTRDLLLAKDRLEDSNAHLQSLADTDVLTGVATRRKLLATLEDEWRRVERDGLDLCLLMFDIDRFKAVNDGHGHVAGDRVIRAFAEICRIQLPAQGCIGRLGGEEFAIILPGAFLGLATLGAERIRHAVKASPIVAAPGVVLDITVSIGVTRRLGTEDTPDALMARADEALYDAKRKGRDRVVCRADGLALHGHGSAALAAG